MRLRPLAGQHRLQSPFIGSIAAPPGLIQRDIAVRAHDHDRRGVSFDIGLIDRILLTFGHLEGLPIKPMFTQDPFAGIGQVVHVHAHELEPSCGVMLHLGLLPVGGQSLEVLQAIAFLRPTIDRSCGAQKVQREACHRAIAPLKGANEGRAKDLARQLLALEVDQIHVPGETLRHDLAEVVDQLGIP